MKALVQTFLFIVLAGTLNSQDLTGRWSGALHVQGNELRIILTVNKTGNQYEATMDSPDQNVSGLNVTAVAVSYPNVRFEISSIGAVYEGLISEKGLTGKWMQSGTYLFLELVKDHDDQGNGK